MIVHDIEQGSQAWHAARLGIPTASNFHLILTPKKLEISKSMRPYAHRLVAERLLNRSMDPLVETEWMARGKALEPDAARMFELAEGVKTRKIGFITTDDGRAGASPDRMVGDFALLELKVPAPQTHIGYLVDGFGDDYVLQAQGQMLVAELDCNFRVSYSDELPPRIERTPRDDRIIAKLQHALTEFCDLVDEMEAKALSLGAIARSPFVLTPVDTAYGDERDDDDSPAGRFLHSIPSFDEIDRRNPLMGG